MLKGFPNQIANLVKLARALGVAQEAAVRGENIRDDGVLGEALVRAQVLGTGHTPRPIDEYLDEQRQRQPSLQSHRTSARGLRELFRLMRCMEEDSVANAAWLTPLGETLARNSLDELSEAERAQWRVAIASIRLGSPVDGVSHPYQVLLRLVAARPGITRAKSALCLEATDDSVAELERICLLADVDSEDEIRARIGGETPSNWDNAKKVLPAFAEQLGDIEKRGHNLHLPAAAPAALPPNPEVIPQVMQGQPRPRRARTQGRRVDPATIARAGVETDEANLPSIVRVPTPEEVAATNALRAERLTRHNQIVRQVAVRLNVMGASLHEDPFDCLARIDDRAILIEVKTLSGEVEDERSRVRDALSQLLYYCQFALPADCPEPLKIALFESKPSDEHIEWLASAGIHTLWCDGDALVSIGDNGDVLITQLTELDPA